MAYKCFNLAARNNYNGPTSNFNDTKIGRYLLVIHFRNRGYCKLKNASLINARWKNIQKIPKTQIRFIFMKVILFFSLHFLISNKRSDYF